MTKMDLRGDGEYYVFTLVCDKLGLNSTQFLDLCILAGCDYFKNVKGIGIHTAYKMLQKYTTSCILEQLTHKVLDYSTQFTRAKAVFQHQSVFYIFSHAIQPCNAWDCEPTTEIQHACGEYP
jgi:exonuclease-1